MGAIFGVIGKVSDHEIKAMAERLSHRERHTHIARPAENLCLGSIGTHPENNIYVSASVAVICDASLLNTGQLPDRIKALRQSDGQSNAAILIHAIYTSEGSAGLDSLKGNYAFSIVDLQQNRVVFGRDYFGSKPLYYSTLAGKGIAFASEYKALLSISSVPREVDLDVLQHLQCNKNVPSLRTLIKNIRAQLFGGISSFDDKGNLLDSRSNPPLAVNRAITDEAEAIELLATEFTEAVARQCQDHERLGIALSGGIDSISVAFVLRRLYPEREIHTFTAGNDPEDPEIITARRVAEHIESTHHEIHTPPELLKTELRELIWHLEDPIARSEVMQLFQIGKIAGEFVDVLLSGQGADSMFGGMPRYKLLWLMKPLLRVGFMRKPLTEFYNRTQLGLKPSSLIGSFIDWIYYRGKFPAVPEVLGARLPESISLPAIGKEFVNTCMARGYQKGQAADFPKYERSFGVSGLDYRSPFCDETFARVGFSVSDKLKIHRGKQKYILRKSMQSIVPDQFLEIPKYMQTMKHDNAFSDVLDSICASVLSRENVDKRGFFNYTEIVKIPKRAPGKPHSRDSITRLWTLVCTEIWAQEFLDR